VLINLFKSSNSDNNEPSVLSHLKLSPIPSLPFACFIESVVVWKNLRGQGLGKYLMQEAESYCKNNMKLHEIYLSTTDKEEFYKKLGYVPCEPISLFGGPSNFPFRPGNQKKKYMKKVLIDTST
jgi:predicted GNAT family N-acyltransferase